MRTVLFSVLFVVTCSLISLPLRAQPSSANMISIRSVLGTAQTLWIPAPLGTSSETLGLGFNAMLTEFDTLGRRHRVYSGKHNTVHTPQYNAHCTIIDNEFEFRAHAHLLGGVSISAAAQEKTRYAVFSVYHIQRTETIAPDGGTPPHQSKLQADFFAQKIHYGWAVHCVVYGEESNFTASASADMLAMFGAGGDVSLATKEHRLQYRFFSQGLRPIKTALVFSKDSIQNNFVHEETDPQPIFVELFPLNNMTLPSIRWRNRISDKEDYVLDSIRIELTPRKDNNTLWDNDGIQENKPDFVAFVNFSLDDYSSGMTFLTDSVWNTTHYTFPIQRVFPLSRVNYFGVGIFELDSATREEIVRDTASKNRYLPIPKFTTKNIRVLESSSIGVASAKPSFFTQFLENEWIWLREITSCNIRRIGIKLRRDGEQ